ncbi:sugar transferase [soil metagenome]
MIWRPQYHSKLARYVDFLTSVIAYLVAYFVHNYVAHIFPQKITSLYNISNEHYLVIFILALLNVFIFKNYKAYNYQRFTSLITEYKIILKVTFITFLVSVLLTYMFRLTEIPRSILAIAFGVNFIFFVIQKTTLFHSASYLRKHGKNRKKIIIAGSGNRAQHFIQTVNDNFEWGLDIIAILSDKTENIGKTLLDVKIVDILDNIENVLKDYNPEEVIIAMSTREFERIRNIIEICQKEGTQVRMNSDFFGQLTKNLSVDNVFGLNIISFHSVRHSDGELFVKRLLDIMISLIAIILFSPVMIIAAIGIYLSDGSPILYNWNVIGYNKKPFKSWKFRTMVNNADELKKDLMKLNQMDGPVFKIDKDPRIIPIGRILRKFSIDETPQFFSVLKGDMSIVGPRPPLQYEFKVFDIWHRRKLSVKPGLTCLWQISGRNNINNFDDWAKLDLEYIDNWSIWLDLKILLKTIPAVLTGKGAK